MPTVSPCRQPVPTLTNIRNRRMSRVSPIPPRPGRGDILISIFIYLISCPGSGSIFASQLPLLAELRVYTYTMHAEWIYVS